MLALTACDSPTIPRTPPEPAAIEILSGDRQSAAVGSALAIPLLAQVQDANGEGLSNERVTFTVMAGGGTVTPVEVLSDVQGIAQARWTLGTSPAEPQQVEASVVSGTAPLRVQFNATAITGGPTTITKVAGDGQAVEAGSAAAEPLVVKILDRFANPVSDVAVTWVVIGGGAVAPASARSDAQGLVKARWTLGTSIAEVQLVEAAVESNGGGTALWVAFDAIALSGPPASIKKVAGDGQSLEEETSAIEPLVVKVLDRFNNPVKSVAVSWAVVAGGGALTSALATTDDQGVAAAQWNLPRVGSNTARAVVEGLGAATFDITITPVLRVAFASSTAGYTFSCALSVQGVAYCWGENGDGQLGDGTVTSRTKPTLVAGGLSFTSISSGMRQTCGVTAQQRVYCWGESYGPTPVRVDGGVELVDVTVGIQHACGLSAAGAAYCWGYNRLGALGTGDNLGRAEPTPVVGGLVFQSLSAGWFYTCGVTMDGAGYCWGEGGALGSPAVNVCDYQWEYDYEITCTTRPALVGRGERFTTIRAGEKLTCALAVDGAASCWGLYGASPSNDAPIAVPGGLTFRTLDVDASRACGIATSGQAFCWGWIVERDLYSDAPVQVGGSASLVNLSVGWFHSCGVAADRVAYCWGLNARGEVGDGSRVARVSPVKVAARP